MYIRTVLSILCLALLISISLAQGRWEVINSTSGTPSQRYYTRMVEYNNTIVVFGGTPNGNILLSDVYQCNHTTANWKALTNSPYFMIAHSVVVTKGGLVIAFAGSDGARHNRVTTFDINTQVWDTPPISGDLPPVRTLHTAVIYQDSAMIVFGGGTGNGNLVYGDVWSYNISSPAWTQLSPSGPNPTPRSGHTAVMTADGIMIIYGGWNGGQGSEQLYNDIAYYQVSNNSWLPVSTKGSAPAPTFDHSAVLTSGNVMLVFGGRTIESAYVKGTISKYDVATSTWLQSDTPANAPPGRSAAAYALVNDYLVVFAGLRDGQQRNDLVYYSEVGGDSTFTVASSSSVVSSSLPPTTAITETPVSTSNTISPLGTSDQNSDKIVDNNSSDGNNSTPVIAAVVGTVGIVVLVVSSVAIFCLVKKRRNLKKQQEMEEANLEMNPDHQTTNYAVIDVKALKEQGQQMSSWEVDWNEIDLKNELGRGAYGVVSKANWRMQVVAVKKIIGEFTHVQVEEFMLEAQLMSKLRPHANVVQFLGVSKYPLAIITNFYEGGALTSFLKDHQSLTELEIITILQGVAAGMEHLNLEKIIHRDLAARNILIGVDHGTWKAVVSDFGFARVIHMNEQKGETKSNIGPVRWMAPESIINREYSSKSDVWSFGVLIWEVITKGEQPWGHLDDVGAILAVTGGQKMEIPKQCPEELAAIMSQCWEDDPEDRPSFRDLYSKLLAYQEMLESQNS